MTLARLVPVFTEKDTLPGPEGGMAFEDRYLHTRSCEDTFDVGGHVIRSFGIMSDARKIFGGQPVKIQIEVMQYRRIGILIDAKCRRRVLDEDLEESFLRPM